MALPNRATRRAAAKVARSKIGRSSGAGDPAKKLEAARRRAVVATRKRASKKAAAIGMGRGHDTAMARLFSEGAAMGHSGSGPTLGARYAREGRAAKARGVDTSYVPPSSLPRNARPMSPRVKAWVGAAQKKPLGASIADPRREASRVGRLNQVLMPGKIKRRKAVAKKAAIGWGATFSTSTVGAVAINHSTSAKSMGSQSGIYGY